MIVYKKSLNVYHYTYSELLPSQHEYRVQAMYPTRIKRNVLKKHQACIVQEQTKSDRKIFVILP